MFLEPSVDDTSKTFFNAIILSIKNCGIINDALFILTETTLNSSFICTPYKKREPFYQVLFYLYNSLSHSFFNKA